MADGVKCFKCGQIGHWSRDCTKPPSEWLSRPKAPAVGAAAASAARPSFTPDRADTARPSSTPRSAAPTPAAVGTQPRAQGCYKCGKTGHWARDCTAPPAEQIPRTFDAAENQPPPNTALPKSDAPKKIAPKRKRKIKIRFAELKERDALSDVFCNFPERFAKQFKGKGHEVSDLRRLLEMYKIWQQKHFPLHGFDEALDQIADIGKTNQLKMEMREMRQGALKVMQRSQAEAEQQQEDVVGEAEGGSMAAEKPATAPAGGGADWDEDDELLAMQQEAWEQEAEAVPMDMLEGGSSAVQRAPASRAGPSEAAHALPGQATASQLAEDEELLALAMEDIDEPSRHQPAAPREDAPAQQLPSLSQLAEDEELLALAMEEDEPQHNVAAPAEPAQIPGHQQQPSAAQPAEDEQLATASDKEALKHPSQSQLHTQQKLSQASTPAAERKLGRLSRLSQLSASQPEQQAAGLKAADNQELLPHHVMEKRLSQVAQPSKQAAMAEPQDQESEEEEDDAPLVFTRKKQAVLSE